LPSDAFDKVVIVLIVVALAWSSPVRPSRGGLLLVVPRGGHGHDVTPALIGLVGAAGIYGGYFGAAQGIILTAVLGIFLNDHLQRLNACKNVLAFTVNTVAAVLFIATTSVDWKVVGMHRRRLHHRRPDRRHATAAARPASVRALIVVVGLTALVPAVVTRPSGAELFTKAKPGCLAIGAVSLTKCKA
jgi:hypothetical protein